MRRIDDEMRNEIHDEDDEARHERKGRMATPASRSAAGVEGEDEVRRPRNMCLGAFTN